jgi:hypothetical protein
MIDLQIALMNQKGINSTEALDEIHEMKGKVKDGQNPAALLILAGLPTDYAFELFN